MAEMTGLRRFQAFCAAFTRNLMSLNRAKRKGTKNARYKKADKTKQKLDKLIRVQEKCSDKLSVVIDRHLTTDFQFYA